MLHNLPESVVRLGTDATANVAAINAAFTALKDTNGIPHGHLVLKGDAAPINATLDFNLGQADVSYDTHWVNDTGARFHLRVDGSLTPSVGIGTAITVRGGYYPRIDVELHGGGQSTDVGLHLENLWAPYVAVRGSYFAGTLLHADANGDITKRVRNGRIAQLSAQTCGQAVYFRAIEAFGTFDYVWDNNCANGAVFDTCADIGIKHWESFTPATQGWGLFFDQCNLFQVGAITMGDRPTTGLVRIRGGNFGRVNQIRCTGNPDISSGYTITGVLLEDVSSIDVDTINTSRCLKGVEIKGGVETGGSVRIKTHRSITNDVTPLTISAGTGTTPRAEVKADYRNHSGASVVVGAGLTGGSLELSGYMRDMWNGGAAGKYAVDVDATSGSFALRAAGLTQVARSGISGFTNHPTPANVDVSALARLGDTLKHGATPAAAGVVAGTVWQNTSTRTAVLQLVWRFDPSTSSDSGVVTRVGPDTGALTNVGNLNMVQNAASDEAVRDLPITLIVPAKWGASVTATGAGGSIRTSFVYYI